MSQKFPQKFGKYILLDKLATGGMAEIFKAKAAGAEGFEKDIVIKRILPHFSEDRDFVKMFIDEASITAKLQHANIVQIFDFDVYEGAYYIAMEYIEGEDLSNVLKFGEKTRQPLSVAQCVAVAMELAKGLHYAHTKEHKGRPLNIIHRDISPHNAMISYLGEVKLMDFGIAKAAERSTKTQAGTVKGKVAYMSPEQARGKPLDPRSDLFALATVLWEMLTGERLFLRVTDFETLTAVLKDPAAAPSSLRPGVDQELDGIILQALAKDREQRHADVEAFNRDLTRWYYKNVDDLDAESLKTYMQTVYEAEIARRRAQAVSPPPRPRGRTPTPTPTPTPGLRRKAGGTRSAPHRVRTPGRQRRRSPSAVPRPPPDLHDAAFTESAMTVEEPVPELLKASLPRRDTGTHKAARQARRGKGRRKRKPQPDDFFSASGTMLEGDVSTADVQEAIRAAAAAPDVSLDGRVRRGDDAAKSRTGIVVALAIVMLGLGGLLAFLLAP
ncbi:MAG: hypothetical protein CSA66_00750 [Proteobacteria bacterium]|nr:MAG: hypothetical protein CSA66_00750 [Pseudomonadota bacterium]